MRPSPARPAGRTPARDRRSRLHRSRGGVHGARARRRGHARHSRRRTAATALPAPRSARSLQLEREAAGVQLVTGATVTAFRGASERRRRVGLAPGRPRSSLRPGTDRLAGAGQRARKRAPVHRVSRRTGARRPTGTAAPPAPACTRAGTWQLPGGRTMRCIGAADTGRRPQTVARRGHDDPGRSQVAQADPLRVVG